MRVKDWNRKKNLSADGRVGRVDGEEDEHKRIMKEAELLDKLSDCSAEVPQELEEETYFESGCYAEVYKPSVQANLPKKKIVFRSRQIEREK